MRILLTGANGQVGQAVCQRAVQDGLDLVALTRADLDITDHRRVSEAVTHYRPTHIINAAAYTSVDQAEGEPEQAMAINAVGPGLLAKAAHQNGAMLVHYSSDYVFDGSGDRPWVETDAPGWPVKVRTEAIKRVTTDVFPVKAKRSHNSRLDCTALHEAFGIVLPDWRSGVSLALQKILASEAKGLL